MAKEEIEIFVRASWVGDCFGQLGAYGRTEIKYILET